LRALYVGYARPAALYAAGVWFPFLAPTHVARLESANYAAARVITGAPAGSNAIATCRETGLMPLALLAKRDSASLLLHAQRFPANHALHGLTQTVPDIPRRLRAVGGHRGNWFDTASAALSCLPPGVVPEPWPDCDTLPAPWSQSLQRPIAFFLAGEGIRRDDTVERRRFAALDTLERIREECSHLPAIEIWTDGAARGGTSSGGAGVVIRWHDGRPDSVVGAAAGVLASSTAAESAAALLGVRMVAREIHGAPHRVAIRLLFDSRALFARLQRPAWRMDDSTSRDVALCLGDLAESNDVAVIWVPGHSGLASNVRADAAATYARDHADQEGVPIQVCALRQAVSRSVEQEALEAYRAALTNHTHFEASGGGRLVDFSVLP
jgi:ribonuclease HI